MTGAMLGLDGVEEPLHPANKVNERAERHTKNEFRLNKGNDPGCGVVFFMWSGISLALRVVTDVAEAHFVIR